MRCSDGFCESLPTSVRFISAEVAELVGRIGAGKSSAPLAPLANTQVRPASSRSQRGWMHDKRISRNTANLIFEEFTVNHTARRSIDTEICRLGYKRRT